jgi:trimeric autotransporter adhesin
MTRARDVANVLSTATALATDTETAAAISSHATASNGHISYGNTAGRPASPITGQVYANTQSGFIEIYTGATYGWEQVGPISSTPTGVTATNQGSGRAYNNGQASVSFSAGTIPGRSYTATSSPGGYTGTSSSSPITVTGLQSSTQYTYTVTSTNNYGTSAASSASAGVTATTIPQTPTIGTATGANQSATLTFTAGNDGGSSITNYKYSTDNSTYTAFSPAQTSSPLTISGLTNGQSYSFYLKSVNSNGDSAASAASNSITAQDPYVWTSSADAGSVYLGGVFAHNSTFIALPYGYQTASYSTNNAVSWSQTQLPASGSWVAGASNGTIAVIANYGISTVAGSSSDGITWTQRTEPASSSGYSSGVWGSSKFVFVSNNGAVHSMNSSDGITWTGQSLPFGGNWYGIAWNGTRFAAVQYGSGDTRMAYSTNGTTWSTSNMPTSGFSSIASNGSGFTAVTWANTSQSAATSPDGITWTARTTPANGYDRVVWNGGNYVAIKANSNVAATSPDGITWTARTLPVSANWQGLAYNGQVVCAVGYYAQTVTTTSK